MPNTDDVAVPLSCPRCGHDGARIQIANATVLTVKCVECLHPWSVDSGTLPPDIREKVTEATTMTYSMPFGLVYALPADVERVPPVGAQRGLPAPQLDDIDHVDRVFRLVRAAFARLSAFRAARRSRVTGRCA